MAVYEHTRKYKVVYATKDGAQLTAPSRRRYWDRFLTQSAAVNLFRRSLKVGDTVIYKRVSNRLTTYYKPFKLK